MRMGTLTAVIVSTAVAVLGCGSESAPSEAELEQARREGAQAERQDQRIRSLEEEVREERKQDESSASSGGGAPSGGASSSGGTRSCGGGLSVGPNTSCPFAQNVRSAYQATGSSSVEVYSPATGQTYVMTCSSGSPHECTGGNNASVYFP